MTRHGQIIPGVDEVAVAVKAAIVQGDLDAVQTIVDENPELATAYIDDGCTQRTVLHLATDWPGNFPNVAATIEILVDAGADVDARTASAKVKETPLLWAASSNDVAAIDALVQFGANLELDGSVTDGGTALCAAVNFGNWAAARRLVEHGAKTVLYTAAALGMLDRVQELIDNHDPSVKSINYAFWLACSEGQTAIIEYLLTHGADLNWIPDWDSVSPLDVATKNGHSETVDWLAAHGASTAAQSEP